MKGFRDVEDSSKKILLRRIIEDTFELYGFRAVETPIIEYEEFLLEKSSGNNISDFFKVTDKGKRRLALRYEFTFQLKRLARNKKLPLRVYQIGPVFRDEPIRGNRWRQFTQCDADIIGSNFKDEAELLKMSYELLRRLGIKPVIFFNNRKLLNEILEEIGIRERDRFQVLREIDKLDKISEKEVIENLKQLNAAPLLQILKKPKTYFKKYSAYKEIVELEEFASENLDLKLQFQPFMVRGLAYYTGTIFEIKSDIKESIAGGGTYVVNGFNSTGISFGLERLELVSRLDFKTDRVLIVSLEQDKKAFELASKLRGNNIKCQIFYGKPSKALDYANVYGFNYAVFVGEEELKKKRFRLKELESGKESELTEKRLFEFFNRVN